MMYENESIVSGYMGKIEYWIGDIFYQDIIHNWIVQLYGTFLKTFCMLLFHVLFYRCIIFFIRLESQFNY